MKIKRDEQLKLEQLNSLLEFVSANTLRKSISTLLFSFLLNEESHLNSDYKEIIIDIKFLLEFLEKLDNA